MRDYFSVIIDDVVKYGGEGVGVVLLEDTEKKHFADPDLALHWLLRYKSPSIYKLYYKRLAGCSYGLISKN